MAPRDLYQDRLTTPDEAIAGLPDDSDVVMSMAVSQPPALLAALERRIRGGGLSEVRVHYFHSEATAGETILQYDLMDVVKPHCFFLGAIERELQRRGDEDGRQVVFYVPNSFGQAPRYLTEYVRPDAFLVTVSPMDRAGYFTFGTNNDYGSTVARRTRKLIVEVNPRMPRVFGDSLLHVSEVDMIVEHEASLIEHPAREPQAVDLAIGAQIAEMVPDGATIQMGIGGVPNAVCAQLHDHADLGIHSELMSPGMVDLVRRGAVTGRRKRINRFKHVFTFALGDQDMYDFIDDNPSMESYPVSYVNAPAVIARNDRVVSINAILEIDLLGQANAESLRGRQLSGAGGQLDFVRGAFDSRGGKSIIAFQSTAHGGDFSRIVGRLQGPVTDPRMDTHIVVTEHGWTDLKAKSVPERAAALIGLADPRFRGELEAEARDMGLF